MNAINKTTKTTCPYCGVGCGVEATVLETGEVKIAGDKSHPANFGRLCSKGSALGDTVAQDNRLLFPSINGERVSWDSALEQVSSQLSSIIAKHGPDSVAFYVSGQLLTEDYYVANKLMKGFIGSANIDTNSRLCMSSAVAGYKRAFGVDGVPCSYADLEIADLIVIEGSNTAWCHPVVFQRIVKAKQARPEMKIVVIDPRKTATCDIADLHLPLRSGTDTTLFNGLLNYLAANEFLDNQFIANHTDGFDNALAASQAQDIDAVAAMCDLPKQDIEAFYQLYAETEKVVTLYSQGVNQSSSGTDNSNSIINCHLATGRIGKPAMGPFSITGQPNAMGGREVGGLANQLAAHMDIQNPKHHDLVSRFWQTDKLATQAGAKAVDLFRDVESGKIKAVWIMATNPVVSLPDADQVKNALAKCDLVIVSDCEANTDTTDLANILLPAQGWSEKDGTVTNSERRISHQRGFLTPVGEAKADWWIMTEVAKRMGFAEAFPYQSAVEIFREHAALSAFENNGERDFDIGAMATISDQDYADLNPIQWPVNADNQQGQQRLYTDNQFFTANGRAQFISIEPHLPENQISDRYPLVLNTGRIRDQWHTMTRTARSPKLNAHLPEPFVEVCVEDIEAYQLQIGGLAKIESAWGKVVVRVQQSDSVKAGNIFVSMHWNAQYASLARVDAAVNPAVDPISGQPESKHTPVSIELYQPAWHGFILSREPIELGNTDYWTKAKGQQFWRYEIAGETQLESPEAWVKQLSLPEGDWLAYQDKAMGRYRAALVQNDQIQLVVMLAPDHDLPSRSWLSQLFAEQTLSDEMRNALLAGKPGAGLPDIGPIVCACFGVGENTLKEAVSCGNAKTVEQLGEQLKAGTNCGSCIPELRKLIASA
jgi:assimilatory nitrate reductase catalytic subunit